LLADAGRVLDLAPAGRAAERIARKLCTESDYVSTQLSVPAPAILSDPRDEVFFSVQPTIACRVNVGCLTVRLVARSVGV
jgi:hypothetical protein